MLIRLGIARTILDRLVRKNRSTEKSKKESFHVLRAGGKKIRSPAFPKSRARPELGRRSAETHALTRFQPTASKALGGYLFSKYSICGIVLLAPFAIFTTVFHRILDFKNGAGFLSWPLFLLYHLQLITFRLFITVD